MRPSPLTDLNLINKRFFQSGNKSSGPPTWSSKLFAAVGVLLGVGGGAAFNAMNDIDSITGINFVVAAAGNDQCGCNENKCVDKRCDDSICLRSLECEEELISKANCELERALKDTKGKAIQLTESAMKAYCEAITAMCEFLTNGYGLIDNDELEPPDYEEAWCCLYGIAKKRCEKVKDAIQKGQCAWELLCRLREVIENGKACKYTSCNPLLITAEDALTCAEKELLDLKAKMDCARSDHTLVGQYKSVIDNFRDDLKTDVERYIMDTDCNVQFVEQELAMQIQEAYKRVIRVHKEVARSLVCRNCLPERLAKTCC